MTEDVRLTGQQIMSLLPGEALDHIVARVIGCVGVQTPAGTWWYLGRKTWNKCPAFSTNVGDAMMAAEHSHILKLWKDSTGEEAGFVLYQSRITGDWCIKHLYGVTMFRAATLPLVISQAIISSALRVVISAEEIPPSDHMLEEQLTALLGKD